MNNNYYRPKTGNVTKKVTTNIKKVIINVNPEKTSSNDGDDFDLSPFEQLDFIKEVEKNEPKQILSEKLPDIAYSYTTAPLDLIKSEIKVDIPKIKLIDGVGSQRTDEIPLDKIKPKVIDGIGNLRTKFDVSDDIIPKIFGTGIFKRK